MDLLLAAMPPPAHKTLAAWATDRLREEILSGHLAPGRRLYEQELASAMNISRTPVRDALRALEREHLVTIAPNRETVVTAHTATDVREIYQLRAALEGMAVRLAIEVAAEAVAAELFEIARHMGMALAAAEYGAVIDLDLNFHDVILRGARNVRLIDAAQRVHGQVRRYLSVSRHAVPSSEEYNLTLVEHAAIAEAVRDKQPDRAEALLRAHIIDRGEYIARVVGDRAASANPPGAVDMARRERSP